MSPVLGRLREVKAVCLAGLSVLAGVLALASPAAATFSGRNGAIAYTSRNVLVIVTPDGKSQALHHGSDPKWSPDGTQIAYIQTGDDPLSPYALWTMRADGHYARKLVTGATDATWSPSGKQIAFTGPRESLWVMRSDGSRRREIFHKSGFFVEFPNWSPDGREIVFTGALAAGNGRFHGLYTISPDGGSLHHLLKTVAWTTTEWTSWSPTGRRLAFIEHSPRPVVVIFDTITRKTSTVPLPFDADTVVWSPDSRRFAFSANGHLYEMNTDGTNPKVVDHLSSVEGELDWQSR